MLSAGPASRTLKLWYDEPASRWEEALPLGNGRLGVMVYGGSGREELHRYFSAAIVDQCLQFCLVHSCFDQLRSCYVRNVCRCL